MSLLLYLEIPIARSFQMAKRTCSWDLNMTLTQLSMKAGLAADDWKEGASFLVFRADVFCEGEK